MKEHKGKIRLEKLIPNKIHYTPLLLYVNRKRIDVDAIQFTDAARLIMKNIQIQYEKSEYGKLMVVEFEGELNIEKCDLGYGATITKINIGGENDN